MHYDLYIILARFTVYNATQNATIWQILIVHNRIKRLPAMLLIAKRIRESVSAVRSVHEFRRPIYTTHLECYDVAFNSIDDDLISELLIN